MIIVALTILLCPIVVCSAKPITKDNKQWHTIQTISGTIHNSSAINPDEEEPELNIKPAPQPVSDLPSDRVFPITTLSISFLIILMIWSESIKWKHFLIFHKSMKRGSIRI